MACGCSNNKKLDNKRLNLDDMKNMSADEIVKLYKDGYVLDDTRITYDTNIVSNMSTMSNIKTMAYSDSCTGYPILDMNRAISATGGFVIYKGYAMAQKIVPTSKCLDFALFKNVKRYGSYDMHFEIRQDSSGSPSGTPGSSTGRIVDTLVTYGNIPTTYGDMTVDFSAILPVANVPYWIVVYSSDYACNSITGGTGYERMELSRSYTNATERAGYVDMAPCRWQSLAADAFAMEIYKRTYVAPSNAQIYNVCWGPGLGTACSIPPQQPVVTSGTTITIKADISNSGSTGKVRAVFKIGGTSISDQNIASLATFPGGGLWSPTTTYQMPGNNVVLAIEGYGWDGTSWILTHTVSSTISETTPTCTGIAINASTVVANVGDTITLTAYGVTPSTQPFLATFTDRSNNILGTCTTSNGTCSIQWNTTGLSQGAYYVKAAVIGQCTSPELTIGLSMPIQQWNVDINVRDSVTTSAIQGANVTVGTQTLQTDATGHVLFRVDQGTIYVTISKTGYNTITSDPQSVYNNVTFNYSFVPVSQNPGSLRFITSPPGISGAEVHFIGDVPTLKGTTDANGIFSISSLVAHRIISYEVRKTGYNIATGSITVVGNVQTDVLVTMTVLTTTGSVCIHSSPSGASIKIESVLQTGKTTAISGGGCLTENIIGNLTAISHGYELSLAGYAPKTGNVTITAGQTLDYDAGALTPLPTLGILNMSSNPSGARIYKMVSSVYQDTGYITGTVSLPTVISDLIAGTYSYKLTLTGYNDYMSTFAITAGQTTTVNPTLVITPPTTGTLSIWSSPTGAHIYTKLGAGQWQDTSHVTGPQGNPTLIAGLNPGNYSYKLTLAEYDDYIDTFVTSAGQTTSANATLVPVYIPPTLATIAISPISQSIGIGGIVQLVAVCKDQNIQIVTCPTLTWTSSDPSKATVNSSGLVTGALAGSTNISADTLGITSNTSVITVTSVISVLTTITITPESASVQIGDTQQIDAICKDQNAQTMNCPTLIWSSSNQTMATVNSSGLVTGITIGSTIVTASASGKTSNISVVTIAPPTSGAGGAGMLFGIVGVVALGIMMSSKKPQQK